MTGRPPADCSRSRTFESGLKVNFTCCASTTSAFSMNCLVTARKDSSPCSMNRSWVKTTSSAVMGLPSENFASGRRVKIAQARSAGYSTVEQIRQYSAPISSAGASIRLSVEMFDSAAATPSTE